jgi:hypothetical protein
MKLLRISNVLFLCVISRAINNFELAPIVIIFNNNCIDESLGTIKCYKTKIKVAVEKSA